MPNGLKFLNDIEKGKILAYSSLNMTPRNIAKLLNRSKTCINNFLSDSDAYRINNAAGRPPKNSERYLRSLAMAAYKNPGSTSEQLAEMSMTSGHKSTICRYLKKDLGMLFKAPTKCLSLTKSHKENRLLWARTYHSTDFENSVIWSDRKRFCFRGPDGFYKAWMGKQEKFEICQKRNCGGIHFWAAFIGNTLIGPYILPKAKTFNSKIYQEILNEHMLPFISNRSKPWPLFMHDNARPHTSFDTLKWLSDKGISLMKFPAVSPDLNPMENVWSIISSSLYSSGMIFSNRQELTNGLEATFRNIRENHSNELAYLAKSVEGRALKVLESRGNEIRY